MSYRPDLEIKTVWRTSLELPKDHSNPKAGSTLYIGLFKDERREGEGRWTMEQWIESKTEEGEGQTKSDYHFGQPDARVMILDDETGTRLADLIETAAVQSTTPPP